MYVIGCYTVLEDKESPSSVSSLMNLEDIMLNSISQTQKYKYCLTSLYMWNSKLILTRLTS